MQPGTEGLPTATRRPVSGARAGGHSNRRRFPPWRWLAVIVVVVILAVIGVVIGADHQSGSPAAATATAENATPKGANELAWSTAILKALGDPLTSANIQSLGYWMQNEAGSPPTGIVGANNPINVSQPGYGGTPIKSEGNGYYLYSYPTVTDGVNATVTYLHRSSYTGIVAALKAGSGLSSSSLASEFSTYSGGGYSSVPDSWGASQGQPRT